MTKYLKLMRINHYIKNFLIFLPLFFSGNMIVPEYIIKTLFGFAAFSLVSSAIYTFNDIFDVEKDRRHPVKRNRPIASGAVSVRCAKIFGGGVNCGLRCISCAY